MSKALAVVGELGVAQQAALALLLEGKSVAETARTAGVGRATVFRWLRSDAAFQAAYNEWHEEMQESCRSRMLMLTDKAATAVEKALEAGDAKAALQLLKGLGLLSPQPARSTDPEELRRQAGVEKTKRLARLGVDELMAGIP